MSSQYLPLIIGLLYLAIHVISILAKEAGKRKERERKREEAERRRMTEARMEVPAPVVDSPIASDPLFTPRPVGVATGRAGGPVGAPWSPPAPVGASGRTLDDLAARRKEQLDQLRARRAATQETGRSSATGIEAQQVRLERERREREEAQKRMERQARMQRQREATARAQRDAAMRAQRERQAASPRGAGRTPGIVTTPVEETDLKPATVSRKLQRASSLRSRLMDRAQLHEIVMLREILDKPVSMRENRI